MLEDMQFIHAQDMHVFLLRTKTKSIIKYNMTTKKMTYFCKENNWSIFQKEKFKNKSIVAANLGLYSIEELLKMLKTNNPNLEEKEIEDYIFYGLNNKKIILEPINKSSSFLYCYRIV